MATLTVQELPANGQGFGGQGGAGLTFTAAAAGGDEFSNTGREVFLIKGGAAYVDDYAQIEGVPGSDAGRDGTATADPGAVDNVDAAGPFKTRNWNTGGVVQVTYPSGVVGLEVAVVRFTLG
jgi:hypothetical protein